MDMRVASVETVDYPVRSVGFSADGAPRARPVPQRAPAPDAAARADAERVRQAARQLDAWLKGSARTLEFRIDDSTGRIVVTVHDSETNEVIRQIPGEEVLRLAHSLQRAAESSSALLDQLA